ncbi:hypothetical protein J6TS1_10590 [Siminovitchia terrae]|uniref:Uncharacterized protein n=1 Tax=Siminovitchia terrae TaxID=1914933 RepID=A0ABQ4KU54_SIMTE|nr:hypothetical protein J6TS1_10590 [Siminovitchia terrae]
MKKLGQNPIKMNKPHEIKFQNLDFTQGYRAKAAWLENKRNNKEGGYINDLCGCRCGEA